MCTHVWRLWSRWSVCWGWGAGWRSRHCFWLDSLWWLSLPQLLRCCLLWDSGFGLWRDREKERSSWRMKHRQVYPSVHPDKLLLSIYCPSVHLSYNFYYLSIYLSIYLSMFSKYLLSINPPYNNYYLASIHPITSVIYTLSICSSIHPSIHLSLFSKYLLSINPSYNNYYLASIHPITSVIYTLSICSSIHPSIYLFSKYLLFINPSYNNYYLASIHPITSVIYTLSMCSSIHPSIYPSIYPSISVS